MAYKKYLKAIGFTLLTTVASTKEKSIYVLKKD